MPAGSRPAKPAAANKRRKTPKHEKALKQSKGLKHEKASQSLSSKPKGPQGDKQPQTRNVDADAPAPATSIVTVKTWLKKLGEKIVREVYPNATRFKCSPRLKGSVIEFADPAACAAAKERGYVTWRTLGCQCKKPAPTSTLPTPLQATSTGVVFFGKHTGQAVLRLAQAAWPEAMRATAPEENTLEVVFPTDEAARRVVAAGPQTVFDDIVLTPSAYYPTIASKEAKRDNAKQEDHKDKRRRRGKAKGKAAKAQVEDKAGAKAKGQAGDKAKDHAKKGQKASG